VALFRERDCKLSAGECGAKDQVSGARTLFFKLLRARGNGLLRRWSRRFRERLQIND